LGEECVYSSIEEPPLPSLPTANPVYNTLSLKLNIDSNILDPECGPPDSASFTHIHNVFEEPTLLNSKCDHIPKPSDSMPISRVHDLYEEPCLCTTRKADMETKSLVNQYHMPELRRNGDISGKAISDDEQEKTKYFKIEVTKSKNVDEDVNCVVQSKTENHPFRVSVEKDLSETITDNYYTLSKVENPHSISKSSNDFSASGLENSEMKINMDKADQETSKS
jgi:hypothetical protein